MENIGSTENKNSVESTGSIESAKSTDSMENTEKGIFRKMEELHRLPLMILAWLFPLFLVKDMVTGILLGIGTVLVFLILEGSRLLFEKFLGPALQIVSYLAMIISLSGIAGILLHLVRVEGTDAPFYCFVLEQLASIYLMKGLVSGVEEGNRAATGKETDKSVWKKLLSCFEIAAEYTIFLGVFGLLREYAGKWVASAGLLSGGLLITSALLFLWKLTKTMPERFEKLPGMILSTGLVVLVLAGFAGLL